ncbi:MAG: large subunit ribosomal protein [Gemmatimonadales bacterium]|jgi:large subunit ribosomal protein L5|nr:large subunit ribosomal protein [Gemmatimonadales bacterium]
MAETEEKAPKSSAPKGAAPKGGAPKGAPGGSPGKGKDKAAAAAVDHAPKAVEGTPRLQEYYEKTIRARLAKEFGLANANQVPRVVKVVLNVGMGDAGKNPKQLDAAVEELGLITGQKAVVTKAKKAIANFGLRAGMPVGATVTLRGARMYEFLDRFINLAVPRIRDFRGLPNRSFDGRGNYTFGIKEQLIFPEIDYDRVEKIHGMDITLVTSTDRDDLAMGLLRELGWPFRGETPQRVA